jgi:hypothetical protein
MSELVVNKKPNYLKYLSQLSTKYGVLIKTFKNSFIF